MPLQTLPAWNTTGPALHRAALLLGAARKFLVPRQPLYQHLALKPLSNGVTTGPLPTGASLRLDYTTGTLHWSTDDGVSLVFTLHGQTQANLFRALFGAVREHVPVDILVREGDIVDAVYASYAARDIVAPGHDELLDGTRLDFDAATGRAYAAAADTVYTAMARFRGGLQGMMTRMVVWPEHFDLSTLWFVAPELDDWKPHLNFGFAPFSPGIDAPYVYAYAYPYPEAFDPPALPAGVTWETAAYQGARLDYATLARQPDPVTFLESRLAATFEALRPLLPPSVPA